MFVVGDRLTQNTTALYISGVYQQGDPSEARIKQSMVNQLGGTVDDYDVFYFDNESTEAERVLDGDEFDLTWTGTIPDSFITALDFSPEDSKYNVRFYCYEPATTTPKSEIECNGTDAVDIKIEIWNPGMTAIINFNGTTNIPIKTPNTDKEQKCTFSSGECTLTLSTQDRSDCGVWKFPGNLKRFGNVRVDVTAECLVLLNL